MSDQGASVGEVKYIHGKRAVYIGVLSYAGGGGAVWAVEGEEYQFTTIDGPLGYERGTCEVVHEGFVTMRMESGERRTIAVGNIGRFDQFHKKQSS